MRTKIKGSRAVEGARAVSTGLGGKVANLLFKVPYRGRVRAPR